MTQKRKKFSGKLPRSFYRRPAELLAPDLIGKILVHEVGRRIWRARIVETEAYVGPHDLACHAAKGRTRRTSVMYLPGGHAYVYFIYGMYDMLNFVTGHLDDPQAVLIRAAEPLDGWHADLSGPGKLCRAMHITRALNGADLTSNKLHLLPRAPADHPRIITTPRIGVDYAKEWKDKPLRFLDAQSDAVSRRPANSDSNKNDPRPRAAR